MSKTQEILDVVNENNEITGQEERKTVHEKGLWHRVVRILLSNQKGELLLQKRKKTTDINPGVWSSSAAGHLNAGEDYLHAGKRELMEELGIETELSELGREKVDIPNDRTFARYYIGECDGDFKARGAEFSEAGFFHVEKIKEMMKENPEKFSPNFLRLFNAYLRKINEKGCEKNAKR